MDKNISDFYKGKDVLVSKKSVKSLSEFFQYVDVARKLVFKNEKIWYRGHADVRYKLIPNIYRQDYSYLKENKITGGKQHEISSIKRQSRIKTV